MSSSRPIPIHNREVQAPGSAELPASGVDNNSHENNVVSQSCPTGGSGNDPLMSPRFQPPRAPVFGSLPDPNYLQLDSNPMPELSLPARQLSDPPRSASVIQFATSLPADIGGYFRQEASSPQIPLQNELAQDEFDLSKSPALAVMSAAHANRQRYRQSNIHTNAAPHANSYDPRSRRRSSGSSYAGQEHLNSDMLARLSISEEQHEHSEDEETDGQPGDSGRDNLDRRASQHSMDRRASYSNVSDTSESGVFQFEDQE